MDFKLKCMEFNFVKEFVPLILLQQCVPTLSSECNLVPGLVNQIRTTASIGDVTNDRYIHMHSQLHNPLHHSKHTP